jgi:hypothetical protein
VRALGPRPLFPVLHRRGSSISSRTNART